MLVVMNSDENTEMRRDDMDYLALQKDAIQKHNITIVENSTCWSRVHAHTDGTRRVCKWKPKNSYASLFTLLHEIGHIETHKSSYKRYEQEYYATTWGVAKMKEYGLPIKRSALQSYKKYIRMTYKRGIRRGLQTVNGKAKKYFGA